MTLVVFDKFYENLVGGAQQSIRTLIENIPTEKRIVCCDVKAAFSAARMRKPVNGAVRLPITEVPRLPYLEYCLNRNAIRRHFAGYSTEDILITQEFWGALAASVFPGKTVVFVRNELSANSMRNYYSGILRPLKALHLFANQPFLRTFYRDNVTALGRASLVIANSKFIAQLLKENIGVDAEILRPSIDPQFFERVPIQELKRRKYIILVGNSRLKGSQIFRQIAKRLPQYEFMIFVRARESTLKEENLTLRPWTTTVSEVYADARMILVPSIWGEGFGRVALEGMSLGIPTIGSSCGALPEVLPADLLIENVWDINSWVERIIAVERQFELYSELSHGHSRSFFRVDPSQQFNQLLKNRLGI